MSSCISFHISIPVLLCIQEFPEVLDDFLGYDEAEYEGHAVVDQHLHTDTITVDFWLETQLFKEVFKETG